MTYQEDQKDDYTREDYVLELFDRMKMVKSYRDTVKKGAAAGNKECADALVLWNQYVKRLRREYAGR